MRFSTFVALVGTAAAVRFESQCGCPVATPAPQYDCGCDDAKLPLPSYAGSAGLDASNKLAQPGAGGSDGYARLSSQSASSRSSIGASQISVPDRNSVTDQAKVHESVAKGERRAQNCQVARRRFSINGEITVDEKYNDNLKGDDTQKKCGQGASQTRSRTQVLNACNAQAAAPITACAVQRGSA